MKLANIKTIFMDYDGTLHDSIKIYYPSFVKAYDFLVDKGYAESKTWTEEEIGYWLGYNKEEMWKKFMPDLNDNMKNQASKIISENMAKCLSSGMAHLYEGSIEVLKYLKNKGYYLVFISNCSIEYKEMAKQLFNLDRYFKDMLCAEEYDFIPKYEIIKGIKNNYENEKVFIGDKLKDIEAGKKNNIYTIGCKYGYGSENELKDANYLIADISDLKGIL